MKQAILVGALCGMLAGCQTMTPERRADLYAAAVMTCMGAQIAAEASVAITADLAAGRADSNAASAKDAKTALMVTTDSCVAISKLAPVVLAGQQAGATAVQAASASPPAVITAPAGAAGH